MVTPKLFINLCRGCVQKIEEVFAYDNRTVRGTTDYVLVSNTTLLTHNNMNGGTGPSNNLTPKGFVSGVCPHHHQRGHLIGNKLGGSGQTINNLVTLTEGTNHPFMYDYEDAIHLYVGNHIGQQFVYQVEAFYDENQYTAVQKAIPPGAAAGSAFGAAGNPYCDFPCPSHIQITFKEAMNEVYPTAHLIPMGSRVGNAAKILNGIYKFHQASAKHIAGKCWAVTD
jgi:DNA/RNA non-specific endonuclease